MGCQDLRHCVFKRSGFGETQFLFPLIVNVQYLYIFTERGRQAIARHLSDHSQWSIGARVHEDLAETKRANAAEETRRINYVAKENRKDGRRGGDQRGWEKNKKNLTGIHHCFRPSG